MGGFVSQIKGVRGEDVKVMVLSKNGRSSCGCPSPGGEKRLDRWNSEKSMKDFERDWPWWCKQWGA